MIVHAAYGQKSAVGMPFKQVIRHFWAVYIVFDGQVGLVQSDRSFPLQTHAAWLLPPESEHGWRNDGRSTTVLSVFFRSVEDALAQRCRQQQHLCVQLSADSLNRWAELGQRLNGIKSRESLDQARTRARAYGGSGLDLCRWSGF